MQHKQPGLWISPTEHISFADSGIKSLSQEIAVRSRSIDFYAVGNFYLPNPDPVLKAQGKDISAYTDLLIDDRVAGGMINRTAASKAMAWSIDKGRAPSRQHKAIQAAFEKLEMNRTIEHILKCRGFGYAPIEVIWGLRDGLTVPVDLKLKPQRWFIFDYDNRLAFWSKDNILNGEALPARKFLCPTNEADYANPYGLGLLSRCFWPVTFKRGGWRFWVKFAEKYGAVWPVGKLPRSATPEQRTDLLDTLEQMVQDGVAVIPDDGSAEFLEAGDKGGTSDLFANIIASANSAISTVWLGHAGAGESTPGKLGGESAAVDVRDDLREDDANLIMQTMQQLINWTCEINWLSSDDAPRFVLKEKEKIDTTQAERDDKLSTSMERSGLKLSSGYYQRTYKLDAGDIEEATTPQPPSLIKEGGAQRAGGGEAFAEPDPEAAALKLLTQQLAVRADAPMTAWVETLRSLTEKAESLEALRDSVLDAFPEMPPEALAQVLAEEAMRAHMIGRLDVDDGR